MFIRSTNSSPGSNHASTRDRDASLPTCTPDPTHHGRAGQTSRRQLRHRVMWAVAGTEHGAGRQLRPACGRGGSGKHGVSCHPQDKEKSLRQRGSPALREGKPGMKAPGRNDQVATVGISVGLSTKHYFLL